MKKLLFIIFLMVFSFAITANAKKPKVVWPKAVLTLKDGTVLNGYLQNDIHFMKKNIYFSETQNGKDVKYKIVDIKSLEVDNALQDGKKRIFILIDDDPKFPFLATEVFKGKHVTGYMEPFAFDNSTHSTSFTGIWTNITVYLDCRAYHYMVDSGKPYRLWKNRCLAGACHSMQRFIPPVVCRYSEAFNSRRTVFHLAYFFFQGHTFQ